MSYGAPTALPRPARQRVGQGLLLLAILLQLAGVARLLADNHRLQDAVAHSTASPERCVIGIHRSLSTDGERIRHAPLVLRIRTTVYLARVPWLLGLSALLLVSSAWSLLRAERSMGGRAMLIVLLVGSGFMLLMLHPGRFCTGQ